MKKYLQILFVLLFSVCGTANAQDYLNNYLALVLDNPDDYLHISSVQNDTMLIDSLFTDSISPIDSVANTPINITIYDTISNFGKNDSIRQNITVSDTDTALIATQTDENPFITHEISPVEDYGLDSTDTEQEASIDNVVSRNITIVPPIKSNTEPAPATVGDDYARLSDEIYYNEAELYNDTLQNSFGGNSIKETGIYIDTFTLIFWLVVLTMAVIALFRLIFLFIRESLTPL